jgi:hypothetical protein
MQNAGHRSGVDMANLNHVGEADARYCSPRIPILAEANDMLEAAIVFLLFFSVLAFAWFYLQRAKYRQTDAANQDPIEPTNERPDATP